jgi:hypothetical protein
LLAISAASAQDTGIQITVDAAKSVDLTTAPDVPAVPRPAGLVTNRPTMPMADYVAAKNAAAAHIGGLRPKSGTAPPSTTGVSLYTQVGSTNESQSSGGGVRPPDGDVATSASWMVQINNDVVTMFNWNTNAFVQKKFSTFFQDPTDFIFAPRVIYDPYWDRFVVLVDRCNLCSGASQSTTFFLMMISKTGDPTGSWWLYMVGNGAAVGDFADFPQLGMDLNSIIITYNDFLASGGLDARTFSIAKTYLYNGLGFSSLIFGGSSCTTAPPYVIDNSGVDYVMAFCPGDNKVFIGSLTNTGLSNVSLHLWDNTVAIGNNGIPPNAPQPGVSYDLDTGDNRFENRSLQVGSRILNTATVSVGGFATAAWFDFNVGVSPHTLQNSDIWFASGSSSDWHPAINANTLGATASTPLGEVFGTWMSVDVPNNVNVQLRAIGGLGDTGLSGAGITVFTSPRALTGQTDSNGIHRTGDYAYIALYPAAALGCQANELGILEGETAAGTAGLWSTRIGIVKHC